MRINSEVIDDEIVLKTQLERFWEVESLGTGKSNFYENFKESIHGNRYVTNLPFKPHHDFLPD